MKKLFLATAIIAGSCSLVMAQGSSSGGSGPSPSPNLTQNPKQGTMRDDNPAKKTTMTKSKKSKKSKTIM